MMLTCFCAPSLYNSTHAGIMVLTGAREKLDGQLLSCETIDDVWVQRGYCLDAPSRIPAGGCRSWVLDGVGYPEQITIERGAA